MPRRVPIPSHLHGRAFTTADARSAGLGPDRLRGRDVAHPFYGVNTVATELDDAIALCRAFLPRLRPHQVFSHLAAARLIGVPLPPDVPAGLIDVSVPWPSTPPQTRGVHGHSLRRGSVEVESFRGLPIVSAADLWCQLSAILSREDLVAAGDYLLSGDVWQGLLRRPFTTRAKIEAAARRYQGKRGAKRIAWALLRLRDRVDSRPETHLRLLLVDAGLPEPLIAHPITVADGVVLHPDLTLEKWRVVFEYEGEEHFTDIHRWRSDISRRELLEEAGWRVVRVTSHDVFDAPDAFLRRVFRILASRG